MVNTKRERHATKTLNVTSVTEESVVNKDELIKERIIIAAFEQFSQYGIKSISMDYIARSIGISKRTIYDYFSDKEELLTEGINYYNRKRKEALIQIYKSTESALEAMFTFYTKVMENPRWYSGKFYDDLQKFPKAIKKLEEEKKIFADECLRLFTQGIEEGDFLQDINYEIVSLLLKKQQSMVHPPKLFANYSSVEVCDTILFTFLKGCCTEAGRSKLDALIAVRRGKL
ncbi:TetR/AcrR family transcriptional regulator [Parabacteroides pacaensis]|uniref:TetR/AcrR family transcriptional regulator n=1 Tax=Parabacteroides pacaensis TaxID=2086575 RepID=UPI001F1B7BCD|nr:TetR/AcrR family transcriptional regulator [Parabacteroides pacaensis]